MCRPVMQGTGVGIATNTTPAGDPSISSEIRGTGILTCPIIIANTRDIGTSGDMSIGMANIEMMSINIGTAGKDTGDLMIDKAVISDIIKAQPDGY